MKIGERHSAPWPTVGFFPMCFQKHKRTWRCEKGQYTALLPTLGPHEGKDFNGSHFPSPVSSFLVCSACLLDTKVRPIEYHFGQHHYRALEFMKFFISILLFLVLPIFALAETQGVYIFFGEYASFNVGHHPRVDSIMR